MFLGRVKVRISSCTNSFVVHLPIFVCGFLWWNALLATDPRDENIKLLTFMSALSHGIRSTVGPLVSIILHSFSQSTRLFFVALFPLTCLV